MTIRKDLSHLPKTSASEGVRSDPDPFIGRAVAAAWLMDNHSDSKPHAVEGTKFRFSMAGTCSRSLAYYFKQTEPTNLPDAADSWRMGLGTMVHEAVQKYFAEAVEAWKPQMIGYPGDMYTVHNVEVDFEVPVKIDRINGSGSADMVVRYFRPDGQRVWTQVIELKTINGFGFKMAATGFKGPAEGPRLSHVQQASLCGYGLDADEVIICYLSMENVSPSLAKSYCDDPEFGRFTAQWSYSRAEFREIAELEMDRIESLIIADSHDDWTPKSVNPEVYDDKGDLVMVTDPRTGAYVKYAEDFTIIDAGKSWNCNYCRYQDRCTADGC